MNERGARARMGGLMEERKALWKVDSDGLMRLLTVQQTFSTRDGTMVLDVV